jgi:hypothetical protein
MTLRAMEGAARLSPWTLSTTTDRTGSRHTWEELLRLVGAVRRLAFDRILPPSEA